jgi:FkbM family methyltransferase
LKRKIVSLVYRLRRVFGHKPALLDLKALCWNPFADEFRRFRRVLHVGDVEGVCREEGRAFPLSHGFMMCKVLGRYWLVFRAGDGLLTTRLLAFGWWELGVTEALVHTVRPGMRCVDVGANVGYFTAIMAELAGPGGRVLAVEPTPALRDGLVRTVQLNFFDDRVDYCFQPLGAAAGAAVRFYVPPDTKNARVIGSAPVPADGGACLDLVATTLDAAVPPGADVDLIKIDAEGAEADIWAGAARVLAHPPVRVILEFNTARPYDPAALLRAVRDQGFVLRYIDDYWGVLPVTTERLLGERRGSDWMLYLCRDRRLPGDLRRPPD